MDKLTLSGIGSFLLGLAGNIAVEVFPMTGWELSQDAARLIVVVCLGLMLSGLILILCSFRRSRKSYSEQMIAISERAKVNSELLEKERVRKQEYRSEQVDKKLITDKLSEFDNYLASEVEKQELTLEQFKSLAPKIYKWYDWIELFFVTLTFTLPFVKKVFRKVHISYVIKFSSKLNLYLSEIGLGTIPVKVNSTYYEELYETIMNLTSGLPMLITTKVYRNIMLSISLNSLRIFRAKNVFWKEIEEHPRVGRISTLLAVLKSGLSVLMVTVDNAIVSLRSEVATDLEEYFEGVA